MKSFKTKMNFKILLTVIIQFLGIWISKIMVLINKMIMIN